MSAKKNNPLRITTVARGLSKSTKVEIYLIIRQSVLIVKGERMMAEEEELAEDYADWTRIVDENTRAGDDCISLVQDYEGNIIDIHKRIKTAYLAGYRAKSQWHDLRENPYDLPEGEGDYLIYTKDFGIEIRNYFADTKGFSCRPSKMVIAWCELPTFKE